MRSSICVPIFAGVLLGAISIQAAPLTCQANAGVPPIARVEGDTEPLADLTVVCTGGTHAALNAPVPQVNITVFFNTTETSLVTANSKFDEALLLVDEPNTATSGAQHRLLNCGQNGAPDSGPSGPGVCEIVSDGNPTHTYDGSPSVKGTAQCASFTGIPTYGCGRPNAFQGRIVGANAIEFLGVPFDAPGAGTRIFRITNLRGNAAQIGPGQILSFITVNGPIAVPIANPLQIMAFNLAGLSATAPGPTGVIQVREGFTNAWKDRDVAFTVGNPAPGNATFIPPWTYNGGTSYPPALAQNVPGTIYNTEDMFQ